MDAVLADTHVLLWYLLEPERLSRVASDALDQAASTGTGIFVSAITLVEVAYLVEKRRLPEAVLQRLDAALGQPYSELAVVPVTLDIARSLRNIPRETVPDMPDRIIAATALELGCRLVSRDRKIHAAQIQTIW